MAINRVLVSVNAIDDRVADCNRSDAELKRLHARFDMELDEFCRMQEMKSLAVAQEILTPEEGAYIYHQMGGLPSTFNSRPLAVKVAITQVMAELMGVTV